MMDKGYTRDEIMKALDLYDGLVFEAKVTASPSLRLRNAPTTEGEIVASMPLGSIVVLLSGLVAGETITTQQLETMIAEGQTENVWAFVEYDDSVSGWCAAWFLAVVSPFDKPLGKSRLGFYIDQGSAVYTQAVLSSGCQFLRINADPGAVEAVLRYTPQATVVVRRYSNEVRPDEMPDPKQGAYLWWKQALAGDVKILRSAGVDLSRAYFAAVNEVGHSDKVVEFETERCRIADQEGLKCACFESSVGTPDYPEYEHMYPAFAAMSRGRHLWATHYGYFAGLPWAWFVGYEEQDYATGVAPDTHDHSFCYGSLYRRIFQVWDEHILPNRWTGMKVGYTEGGAEHIDNAPALTAYLGSETSAWREMGNAWARLPEINKPTIEDTYFSLLCWMDDDIRRWYHRYPVEGIAVFVLNNAEGKWDRWERYDVKGAVANSMFARIAST